MKKVFIVLLLMTSIVLTSCASTQIIDGRSYPPFGIVNMDSRQDPSVNYEISFGSVAVAIILCETIIFPVYVIGWDLFEARSKKVKQ